MVTVTCFRIASCKKAIGVGPITNMGCEIPSCRRLNASSGVATAAIIAPA